MLLWAVLLVLASASGQFAAAPKPVISLHPPWTTVFQGETVNLTCNGFHSSAPEKTKWYSGFYGETFPWDTSGNILKVRESGIYRCQTENSSLSDPVSLTFTTGILILQTPLPVFEGESVVLRCHAKATIPVINVKIFKNSELLALLSGKTEFNIHRASLRDSGEYQCAGVRKSYLVYSNPVTIQVQELFPRPELIASLSQSRGRSQVILSCKTQLSAQKTNVRLHFCFFRNNQVLESGCSDSPRLPISAIWPEYSGFYQCKAGTGPSGVWKESQISQIHMQRAVPKAQLTTDPVSKSVFEGQELVLICTVEMDPKYISISWHRKRRWSTEKVASEAKFKISVVEKSCEGEYYCKAGQFVSKPVNIAVKVPVSQPVLRLSTRKTQFLEGKQVTFYCEVSSGSPNIVYQLFHEDSFLLETTAHSRTAIFSLTAEHSGNYYCTANNGLGPKRSEAVKLSITVPVSQPVLNLSSEKTHFLYGEQVTFRCEVSRGSPDIQYQLFHDRTFLEKKIASSRVVSFSPRAAYSGNYYCTASNGLGPQRSEALKISLLVPVSQPVLRLSTRKTQFLEGKQVTFYCEISRGSPNIVYQLFHEDSFLLETTAHSRTAIFSLTAEHSGNYYCTANNGLGPKRSEAVKLSVTVPVSQPVLTLRTAEAQTVEGHVVTLHCEAHKSSQYILYQLYHENVFLESRLVTAGVGASFSFRLTAEHSGNYYCTAENGFGPQHSKTMSLSVIVPASLPILTLRVPSDSAVVGDVLELHCEAPRGSPPILYQFYHEDVILGSSQALSGGGASFRFPLTEEHSGNYFCEASNVQKAQRSNVMTLNVKVPVSHPVFTLRPPGAQPVVGDIVELHCEALRGSPPILYRFYLENVTLGNSSAHSGGGASLNLILTMDHSGNYFCEADNGLEVQRSEVMALKVTVPVSRPVLTLRVPRAHAVVGDEMELHCEAQRGSPPILYRFYHENVTLRKDSAFSGGGVSFNLSLTAEHSGNYSCEADNGLGAQHSEVVTLFIAGLTKHRSVAVATGAAAGALLGLVGLVVGVLLFYFCHSRRAGKKSASNISRSPSDLHSQETSYHNVPGWIELQPVYINVNPRGGDVVYSEIRRKQEESAHSAAYAPTMLGNKDSSVIYSQVKVASTLAARAQQSATSDPHR